MKKIMSMVLIIPIVLSCFLVSNVSAGENWLWPIEDYYNVNSGYGHRTYNNSWHSGIDIDSIGKGNILGKPVRAAKSGYATISPNNGSAGNSISINHGDGFVSRYLHLNSIAIKNGNVKRGQVIGYAGNTGNSSGPHLHFDIKYNGKEINPMPVNYDGRHTYQGSSAAFSENIRYDYKIGNESANLEVGDSKAGNKKPNGISDVTKTLRWKELNSKYDVTTKELQECLNYIMSAGLKVDGVYGISTHDVVKEFQGKYGLKVDGDAGPKTLTKVNEVLKGMGGTHTHSFGVHYEASHPHRQYRKCTCGHTEYTGKNVPLDTCSQCTTPGKASLLNLKESYIEGTEIQFSWEPTENTTHYNLYIAKCDTNGKYQSYENIFYAESGMTKALQPGKYQVLLQPTNSKAWTDDKSTWRFSNSDLYYFEVLEKHTHTYTTTYESKHPHMIYAQCSCGDIQYTGETKITGCKECFPHEHDYVTKYEKTHPHKKYMECACGERKYTSTTNKLEGCEDCFPIVQKKVVKLQIGIPTMYVDGNSQEIDPGRETAPLIKNDRTLLPIRMVMETFGAYVLWDEIENKVTIDAGTTMMNFWINSTRAVVNGQEYTMDVAPIINNDRTHMPLRFIAEKLGLSVGWNETNQTITIEGSL